MSSGVSTNKGWSKNIWVWCCINSFLEKGKLGPYYKIILLDQEYVLKMVAYMKQKNMGWQLKHKFIIPNLEDPSPCFVVGVRLYLVSG
jgi:hypothetical protein